ncbi:MAG: DUF839 domain-containing protein, partial [Paracoccaceae bacterium]
MTDKTKLSADAWDELNFPRPAETEFDRVVERALSRRGFLRGVLALGSAAAAMGVPGVRGALASTAARFPFTPIDAQTDSMIHVPQGYRSQVLARWGDALFSRAQGYGLTDGGMVEGSDLVFGENTDGMETFAFRGHELIA